MCCFCSTRNTRTRTVRTRTSGACVNGTMKNVRIFVLNGQGRGEEKDKGGERKELREKERGGKRERGRPERRGRT